MPGPFCRSLVVPGAPLGAESGPVGPKGLPTRSEKVWHGHVVFGGARARPILPILGRPGGAVGCGKHLAEHLFGCARKLPLDSETRIRKLGCLDSETIPQAGFGNSLGFGNRPWGWIRKLPPDVETPPCPGFGNWAGLGNHPESLGVIGPSCGSAPAWDCGWEPAGLGYGWG